MLAYDLWRRGRLHRAYVIGIACNVLFCAEPFPVGFTALAAGGSSNNARRWRSELVAITDGADPDSCTLRCMTALVVLRVEDDERLFAGSLNRIYGAIRVAVAVPLRTITVGSVAGGTG